MQTATDRTLHRQHHKEFASSLPPLPDERISALDLEPGADLKVERSSPEWMHRLVYECARRLSHEINCALGRGRLTEAPARTFCHPRQQCARPVLGRH